MSLNDLLLVPPRRAALLGAVLERLLAARRVVLTTHVNADGDGTGSEAAMAAWLEGRGIHCAIVNPTPFPEPFRFLLHRPDVVADLEDGSAATHLREADLFLVLDTSEAKRVQPLGDRMPAERTVVVDHHPPGPDVVGTLAVQDPTAAATGELVYDLFSLSGGEWSAGCALAVYVALVSDTGSFRHGNTSPRVHAIAAETMRRGVDPERVYRRLFGTLPRRRLELLREALGTLQTAGDVPLSWMVVSDEMVQRLGATSEDLEGLIEHVRSLEGTEVALLFRGTPEGFTKMSFRSNGEADVNRIARLFGGGGHVKAAGALVEAPPRQVVPRVLDAARAALRGG